jgi:hypothetical protein
MIVGHGTANIWHSSDGGVNWTEDNPSSGTDTSNNAIMNASGLAMFVSGARIWVNILVEETGAAFLLNIINKKCKVC